MVNAPESAQGGRPDLKATHRNGDALSKVRQNWYVYFRDGAFTFARYAPDFKESRDDNVIYNPFYDTVRYFRPLKGPIVVTVFHLQHTPWYACFLTWSFNFSAS